MKTIIQIVLLVLLSPICSSGQITTPVIRANFGVDADLRANFFNGSVQAGNDDWFNNGTAGAGDFIIDTAGAAAIVNQYTTNTSSRNWTFIKNMRHAQYSQIGGRLLVDALFVRDYHGNDDSTTFSSGGNKNGVSPQNWSCPVAQSVPDKNEILDIMAHIRRAGTSSSDSLWLFGGVSLEGTTGNRYFDFELYQTDIYYDRSQRKFFNYGPDAGHTTWQFDGSGNVTVPGDIIFTVEYSGSSLSQIEARIWVHQNSLSITPAAFNWGGQFDGADAGAVYGYANIQPKAAGAFFTGIQSAANIWAGPFSLVRADNSVVTTYQANQFLEFSVNLTKIGLDPVSLISGDVCDIPFKRIIVKTRSSTSFASELKDFVAPISLFTPPRVDIKAATPFWCGGQAYYSEISVINPHSTSSYVWSTTNGNIVGPNSGTTITVDSPGTYIVKQYLVNGCDPYAIDTVTLVRDTYCYALSGNFLSFKGIYKEAEDKVLLNWIVRDNENINSFYIEKSLDGIQFHKLKLMMATRGSPGQFEYDVLDENPGPPAEPVYYRIRMNNLNSAPRYSQVIKISAKPVAAEEVTVMPNPVKGILNIGIQSPKTAMAELALINSAGKIIVKKTEMIGQGFNMLAMSETQILPEGIYFLVTQFNGRVFRQRVIVVK